MNWLIRQAGNTVEVNASDSKISLTLCLLWFASLSAQIWSVLIDFNCIQLETSEWVSFSV